MPILRRQLTFARLTSQEGRFELSAHIQTDVTSAVISRVLCPLSCHVPQVTFLSTSRRPKQLRQEIKSSSVEPLVCSRKSQAVSLHLAAAVIDRRMLPQYWGRKRCVICIQLRVHAEYLRTYFACLKEYKMHISMFCKIIIFCTY